VTLHFDGAYFSAPIYWRRFVPKTRLRDPLNQKEWSDIGEKSHFTDLKSFFAYQTLTGAILHLFLPGTSMGLIFGLIG